MRKSILFVITWIFITNIYAQYASPLDLNLNWNAKVTDDFNAFNGTLWSKAHHYLHSSEPQIYLRDNIRLGNINGGKLPTYRRKKRELLLQWYYISLYIRLDEHQSALSIRLF